MAKIILFQGDSITDCSRSRTDLTDMGGGYPRLIKADFINLKPDYASIYIGVNDAWHEIGSQNGVDTEKFERMYTWLIDEIQAACPGIKLLIIAPYVLEGTATCDIEAIPDRLARFRTDVAEKAEVCKRIAAKYDLPLIELQPAFDEACTKAPAVYWT